MEAYVFVEHSPECPQVGNRFWRKCRCRKWIYVSQLRKRFSAKTRSWETAEKLARTIEDEGVIAQSGITITEAVKDYLEDKQEQNVSSEWRDKLVYDLEGVLIPWCAGKGITRLSDLTVEHLKEFRKAWTGNPLTKSKKQERYRSFFLYCVRHEWIRTNPVALLSKIKVDSVPTDYFTPGEFSRILWAVGSYHPKGTPEGSQAARKRAGAMLLLLRWSGLRLGDAARLERRRLDANGRLFLYMAKTGDPVYVLIPEHVSKLLHSLESPNPKYFFWTGNGDPKTTVDDWIRTLTGIFKRANLGKRAHCHMTRDTFAVELLLSGVPLDQVSILLGHKSVKVTEKHYSPFCKARQEQLENSVRMSWQ